MAWYQVEEVAQERAVKKVEDTYLRLIDEAKQRPLTESELEELKYLARYLNKESAVEIDLLVASYDRSGGPE